MTRRPILFSLYASDDPSIHLLGPAQLGLGGDTDFGEMITAAYAAGLLATG